MKNKIYLILILFAVLPMAINSCSEDTLDDINKNVNDPSDVASKLIITNRMVSSAFSVTASDLAFYASCYMELNVGIHNQLYNAEIRTSEPTSSTTYNNSWGTIYENLSNLKIIIEKCSKGGPEENNFHTLGIAQVLSAYNLAILTDLFGDVPWTEALQPGIIFKPKLDKQKDIYQVIFKFLDDGIANLGKETKFPPLERQDVFYGDRENSASNWLKFAYGLKARYTMRLSFVQANYSDVINFANQSFTNAGEQCEFHYNGATSKSPFHQFRKDRNALGASSSLHAKLVNRKDPRDAKFFKPAKEGGDLKFAPNGTPVQVQGEYGISALSTIDAPTYLLSYHEVEFLKAEAYARMGSLEEAKSALKNAVIAACGKVNVGISEEEATKYFDDEIAGRLVDAQETLKEIMVQKYIAFYEEEAVEAYNDYRRLKAMGDDFIKLDNPLNAEGKFPLCYTYGASDVTANPNVKAAYGDGTYVYTRNVWWAGGE